MSITNRVNFIMGDAYGKARACAFSAYSYSGRSLPFKCKAKAIAPRRVKVYKSLQGFWNEVEAL
jgi:hypothetical protein